ncbi:MAG: hypothetical protein MJ104_09390, partial [Lachnospiraceae bacterium]|nr:hypothetical protein [Lachnospiraceae bacterium]
YLIYCTRNAHVGLGRNAKAYLIYCTRNAHVGLDGNVKAYLIYYTRNAHVGLGRNAKAFLFAPTLQLNIRILLLKRYKRETFSDIIYTFLRGAPDAESVKV